MRILAIDDRAKAEVKRVKEFALGNRISMHDIMRAMKPGAVPVGDDVNRFCEFFNGYKAVYTVEQQPCGWCHHISVSVDAPKKFANEYAVMEILSLFGLPAPEDCIHHYVEDLPDDLKALNFLFKFES